MAYDWVPPAIVPIAILTVTALLRRYMPTPPEPRSIRDYQHHQKKPPLPTGAIGGTMWAVGILCALSFFLFRAANHIWASSGGPAILHVYETPVIWCFFPGFSALAIPWPLTIWLLRRLGRTDEADQITYASHAKAGYDCTRVMKFFCFFVAAPIGFFTVLAIPTHLTLAENEARVGHYARWRPEVFLYKDALHAYIVDGDLGRDGRFYARPAFLVDFKNGRLDANAAGDGGDKPSEKVIRILLDKTGLPLEHVRTPSDIPPALP